MKDGYQFSVDGPSLGTPNTLPGNDEVLFTVIGATNDVENRIENKSILAS